MAVQRSLEQMSVTERLALIDEIWDSICASGKDIPTPSWHGEVIAHRLKLAEEGKINWTPLEQVIERLEQQLP